MADCDTQVPTNCSIDGSKFLRETHQNSSADPETMIARYVEALRTDLAKISMSSATEAYGNTACLVPEFADDLVSLTPFEFVESLVIKPIGHVLHVLEPLVVHRDDYVDVRRRGDEKVSGTVF